jgi:hypothetical protein
MENSSLNVDVLKNKEEKPLWVKLFTVINICIFFLIVGSIVIFFDSYLAVVLQFSLKTGTQVGLVATFMLFFCLTTLSLYVSMKKYEKSKKDLIVLLPLLYVVVIMIVVKFSLGQSFNGGCGNIPIPKVGETGPDCRIWSRTCYGFEVLTPSFAEDAPVYGFCVGVVTGQKKFWVRTSSGWKDPNEVQHQIQVNGIHLENIEIHLDTPH